MKEREREREILQATNKPRIGISRIQSKEHNKKKFKDLSKTKKKC